MKNILLTDAQYAVLISALGYAAFSKYNESTVFVERWSKECKAFNDICDFCLQEATDLPPELC